MTSLVPTAVLNAVFTVSSRNVKTVVAHRPPGATVGQPGDKIRPSCFGQANTKRFSHWDRNGQRGSRIGKRLRVEDQMCRGSGVASGTVDLTRPHARRVDDGTAPTARTTAGCAETVNSTEVPVTFDAHG